MSMTPVDYPVMLAQQMRKKCRHDEPYSLDVAEVAVRMERRGAQWFAQLTTLGGYSASWRGEEWDEVHADVVVEAIRRVRDRIPASAWLDVSNVGQFTEGLPPMGISLAGSVETSKTVSMETPGGRHQTNTPQAHGERTAQR